MQLELKLVDAFSEKAFGGNQAAVCMVDSSMPDRLLQLVAREMNLAETAFVNQLPDDSLRLRWFTPCSEVDLCGHATLATAHVLWSLEPFASRSKLEFETRSGILSARRMPDGRVELNFPSVPPLECSVPTELAESIGIPIQWCGRNSMDYLVEISDELTLRSLRPNLSSLSKLQVRGLIVTSRSTSNEFDFVSRFFAPAVGVPEDAVTGSAHCALAPYWLRKLGKSIFRAYQASDRGGIVEAELSNDRVLLRGKCVTMGHVTLDFEED